MASEDHDVRVAKCIETQTFCSLGHRTNAQREETRNAKRARERKRRCRYFAINSLASRTKIEEITATSFHMVLDFLHAGRE